jgi:hypothetical protein
MFDQGIETMISISFDNVIMITINDGVKLENIKINYMRSIRRPSAFSNNRELDPKTSNRSKGEKPSSKEETDVKSKSAANMTSVASKVPPPAMSPSRPQQTFYFGQNEEKVSDEKPERKQSAVDKVN